MSKLINFIIVALFTCSILGFTTFSYADAGGNPGKGHDQGKPAKAKHMHGKSAAAKASKVRFTKNDKKTIVNYFNSNPFPAGTLPPGIAKNLARGKPIPPGIAKVFLPSSLMSQLPAYPGFEYRVIGNDVVLVNPTTEIIEDILPIIQ